MEGLKKLKIQLIVVHQFNGLILHRGLKCNEIFRSQRRTPTLNEKSLPPVYTGSANPSKFSLEVLELQKSQPTPYVRFVLSGQGFQFKGEEYSF